MQITRENYEGVIKDGMIAGVGYAIMLCAGYAEVLYPHGFEPSAYSALYTPYFAGLAVYLLGIAVGVYGLWKRWRVAGLVLLGLLCINVLTEFAQSGRLAGILWIAILLYVFIRATRACFFIHPSRWQ